MSRDRSREGTASGGAPPQAAEGVPSISVLVAACYHPAFGPVV